MKYLAGSLIFLCMNMNALGNFGKELQVSLNPEGNYQLGVHYSYESDIMGNEFQITWRLLYGTNISQQELSNLPTNVKWNIYSKKSSTFIFDWKNQPVVSKSNIYLGAVSTNQVDAKKIIGNQLNTILVFSDLNGNLIYNLNIGKLCTELPSYFNNLTQPEKQCSQTTESDIDSAMKSYCAEKELELLEYVKSGSISCVEATKSYSSAGCGVLHCK